MIVTRFAPSPTGFLHIGGLRTALLSWLWARKNNGKFLLRIEDTDLARNSEEAAKAIVDAFEWVGLDYDGEIEYQSKRFDKYAKYVTKLLESGHAYYCYMTKEELDALRESQIARGERPQYDRRYRDGKLPIVEGVAPVVRIKAPLEGSVTFNDGVKGEVTFEWSEVDDFVIARGDGTPTYNFAVAIDDAEMGVTDVIRGDDHLSNTPKQIAIYRALGFKEPKFFHVPMILGEEGKKLSKRDGATDVMEYKTMGYLPSGLLNFLVRLGWSHGDQEIFTMEEMLKYFDPNHINKSASAYNASKLLWLNAQHIKMTKNSDLVELLKEHGVDILDFAKKEKLLEIAKEKAQTIVELASEVKKFTARPESYSAKLTDDERNLLNRFLDSCPEGKVATDYQGVIDAFLKESGIKMPMLGKPLRVAIFGEPQGASLADSLEILGINETKKRVELAQ